MKKERTDRQPGTGRFPKGTSGNPAGRPPGSRNRSTVLMETLLAGQAEQLTHKVIELALAGDINALRLCLDRLLPARKDRPIHLDLPSIEDAQQLSAAVSTVIAAVGAGCLAPSEGEILTNMLAVKKNVLAMGDLERRLEQLEQAMSDKNTSVAPESATPPEGLREGQMAGPDAA